MDAFWHHKGTIDDCANNSDTEFIDVVQARMQAQQHVLQWSTKIPLIALGDGRWGTKGWKGAQPGLSSLLRSGVRRAERDRRCAAISVDEYCTSKVRINHHFSSSDRFLMSVHSFFTM